jgi:hypothetical protein
MPAIEADEIVAAIGAGPEDEAVFTPQKDFSRFD